MSTPRFDRCATKGSDLPVEWLELVHESLIVHDLQGRVIACNAAAERLYGWPREALLGQVAEDRLRSEPADVRRAGERHLLETGRWDGELRRRNAAGEVLQVEVHWALQRDTEGRPGYVIETGCDLSGRRRAEAALLDSEHRYRNLFGAMAASFWELDFTGVGELLRGLRKAGVENYAQYFEQHPDFCRQMISATRIVDVNDETVRLFGRGDKAELMADLNAYWPDESLAVYAASTLAAVGGLSHYSVETRLRRLDGSVFDALFTACFPPDAVARGRLLIGVIDISERKRAYSALAQSEARYRTLFQAMAVAFWQYDSSGLHRLYARLHREGVTDLRAYIDAHPEFVAEAMEACIAIDVNDRALSLFGAARREQLLGPVTRFWLPDRNDAFRRSLESGWRGESAFQSEAHVRTVDGREIDVLFFANSSPEMRAQGVVLVGLIDISAQVEARAALRRVQGELAHAGRVSMLGELTASIAHEVNQPLAAIATNGAAGMRWLSRAEPNVGEVKALLQRMSDDARRAAEIIARIRAMAVRRAPELAPVALDALVQEAVQFLQHELRAQHAQLRLQLASNLPAVQGDRVQLQQVIVNLVVNALQAMAQADSPRRELRIETARTVNGDVELTVLDSGPGIAVENLGRLFESFFSTKANGMGLGLPVCRSIVEAHGGRLVAGNRSDDCGARFAMTLPVATAD